MPKLFGLLLLLAGVTTTRAQVTFTLSATADSSGFGYTAGQAVTFVFTTTGASVAGNAHNTFSAFDNLWFEDLTSDTQLFTQVSGTGLAGTFTRPVSSAGAPFSAVDAIPPGYGQLSVQAKSEAVSSPSIGLTVNGYAVESIVANQLDWGQAFAAPGSYSSLDTFFTPYAGSHALNSGGYVEIFAGGTFIDFTPTSLNIGVTAIPEPAVGTLVAALGALGVALRWRLSPFQRRISGSNT